MLYKKISLLSLIVLLCIGHSSWAAQHEPQFVRIIALAAVAVQPRPESLGIPSKPHFEPQKEHIVKRSKNNSPKRIQQPASRGKRR